MPDEKKGEIAADGKLKRKEYERNSRGSTSSS
jgi:hypothetical protein